MTALCQKRIFTKLRLNLRFSLKADIPDKNWNGALENFDTFTKFQMVYMGSAIHVYFELLTSLYLSVSSMQSCQMLYMYFQITWCVYSRFARPIARYSLPKVWDWWIFTLALQYFKNSKGLSLLKSVVFPFDEIVSSKEVLMDLAKKFYFAWCDKVNARKKELENTWRNSKAYTKTIIHSNSFVHLIWS